MLKKLYFNWSYHIIIKKKYLIYFENYQNNLPKLLGLELLTKLNFKLPKKIVSSQSILNNGKN